MFYSSVERSARLLTILAIEFRLFLQVTGFIEVILGRVNWSKIKNKLKERYLILGSIGHTGGGRAMIAVDRPLGRVSLRNCASGGPNIRCASPNREKPGRALAKYCISAFLLFFTMGKVVVLFPPC